MRIFVPRDAAARALGADAVAAAVKAEATRRGLDLTVVRNGSRGMVWLEPLVEVEMPTGRYAFGPVCAKDVPGLFEAGFHEHALALGRTEDLPWMKRQTRLTFARVGVIDPLSLDDYAAHGGLVGLKRALAMTPEAIVAEVTESGLRGRGGAGFPTGIKWKTVAGATASQKYIVCNADEGDSGTFADRMLMEGDPFTLIEGMAIAGIGCRGHEGLCLHPVRISRCHRGHGKRGASGTWRGPAGPVGAWLGPRLRHGNPRRRRRLCLRRGNVAAELARRQARRGARQAAASRAGRFHGPPDRREQRDLAGHRSRDLREGCAHSTRTSAWAGRAARSRCRSQATCGSAGCSRPRSA